MDDSSSNPDIFHQPPTTNHQPPFPMLASTESPAFSAFQEAPQVRQEPQGSIALIECPRWSR
jgi:hypothetical protein